MITFLDMKDGSIDIIFSFPTSHKKLGVIYAIWGKYYFSPTDESIFDMGTIQTISKKLEELNGGGV